ncbi:Mrp-4p [Tyrophagus putrescentiae]|nr:Mrp-4p [Tyrophagus putrescentiae]
MQSFLSTLSLSTSLHTLLFRITIIPQKPILFCETICQNLDPFDHQTNDQLWQMLELAHLKPFINLFGNGFLTPFLRAAKTSTTIRAQFAPCTILTIAHRLNTIMDSDRVLVLDAGNVAEFDSPANLLADSSTIFYSLAKDAVPLIMSSLTPKSTSDHVLLDAQKYL